MTLVRREWAGGVRSGSVAEVGEIEGGSIGLSVSGLCVGGDSANAGGSDADQQARRTLTVIVMKYVRDISLPGVPQSLLPFSSTPTGQLPSRGPVAFAVELRPPIMNIIEPSVSLDMVEVPLGD
jgi:hypothetical protein